MQSLIGRIRWLPHAAGCLALLLAAYCAAPAAAQTAPAPAGTARIWFYRDYEPSVSLNLAPVELNGTLVGYVQPDGSALYRDVPAGHYRISAPSPGTDLHQDQDVDLAPGQEAFVKILASGNWEAGGDQLAYKRDTFYVRLMPPQIARAQLANHPVNGG